MATLVHGKDVIHLENMGIQQVAIRVLFITKGSIRVTTSIQYIHQREIAGGESRAEIVQSRITYLQFIR